MKSNSLLLLFFIMLTSHFQGISQDLEIRDKAEITYQAELLVSEFQNLLNIVSNSDLTLSETKEIIENSYDSHGNKIFKSSDITLEDDINPNNVGPQNAIDAPVEKYLKDFDLFYEKSDDFTVEFSDIKISKVYNSDYVYVRVYFKRNFKSKHSVIESPYKPVERVAEISAVRDGKKWKSNIVSVVFHDDSNPIEVEELPAEGEIANVGTTVSNTEAYDNVAILEESKRKMEEFRAEQLKLYATALKNGDIAYENENWTDALRAYNDARDIQPYEVYPIKRVNEIQRILREGKFNREDIYREAIFKGDNALKARDYNRAKNFYVQALKEKPSEFFLQDKIKKLDATIRAKANLDSKYFAGDYEQAVKDYNKVIRQDDNNPEYYLGRGKCYFALGEKYYKKAIKDFDQAIEIDINYVDALATRAQYYIKVDEPYKAIEDYSVILANEDVDPKYFAERSLLKLKLNNPEGAIRDLDDALMKDPKNPGLYTAKGEIFAATNNFKKAMEMFDKALEMDSEYAQAHFKKGLANIKMDNIEDAQTDFFNARKLGIPAEDIKTIQNITLEFYNVGAAAVNEKNYELAKAQLGKALIVDEYYSPAWTKMGNIYFELENYPEAIKNYNNAILYDDKMAEPFLNRGLSRLKNKNYENALYDFEKVAELEPNNVKGLEGLGDAHFYNKNYREAVVAYNRANTLVTENPVTLNKLGRALIEVNDNKNALKYLDEATKLDKNYAEAYFNKGLLYTAERDMKNAIKNFDEASDLGFSQAEANLAIGRAYQKQEDYKKAIRSYTDALSYDNTLIEAYLERAQCYKMEKSFNAAIRDMLDARKLDESVESADFYAELGTLNLDLDLNREATAYFRKALEMDEKNVKAIYGMACSYSQDLNTSEALIWIKKAFETREITEDMVKAHKKTYLSNLKGNKEFKNYEKIYLKR
ncbi:tetratricopeptide repeat protein [Flexithrix dorotheae]|uniref:tetratricopeptide repeat protein n=1 Tax=Flexithrix dorotheae TaxID=70993 RepID=UPI000A04993C|nr:tetratricopeptide repeat protein [Flexithrix dorotheae]